MKKITYIFSIIAYFFLVSQSFQCGRSPIIDNCNQFVIDTVYVPYSIINPKNIYSIGDTVMLKSFVNDTINSVGGKSFLNDRSLLYSSIQAFKVVSTNGINELNIANIEFNPFIVKGQFLGYPYNGLSFIYVRNKPFNTLQVGFVAGRAGLYLFLINDANGSNMVSEKNNFCTNYLGISKFPLANQFTNYWDTLGVSSISLANSGGFPTVKKTEKNYFFVRVKQ